MARYQYLKPLVRRVQPSFIFHKLSRDVSDSNTYLILIFGAGCKYPGNIEGNLFYFWYICFNLLIVDIALLMNHDEIEGKLVAAFEVCVQTLMWS